LAAVTEIAAALGGRSTDIADPGNSLPARLSRPDFSQRDVQELTFDDEIPF
jgi:hypothetical protein